MKKKYELEKLSVQAIGIPCRDPGLDALPGFIEPPAGYGEVAFYWWLGDKLTKERIAWQLDQLKDRSISGLQVNYAHSDKGGLSWGLTIPSEPPLFSEEWWELYNWFLKEAQKRNMAVSLSDYTLGPGQGWHIDEILAECPQICGAVLQHQLYEVKGPSDILMDLPENMISLMAYKRVGNKLEHYDCIDLRPYIMNDTLRWNVPKGQWQIAAVYFKKYPDSIDPMNPLSGQKVIEKFFQRFEDRNPGECGKGLNFFFSDELQFGVSGNLWNDRFADEFKKRKGYDIIPELPAIFIDIGPRTPKIRLDYRDVMVTLEEEGYFKPVYKWHQGRGMIYGCDHGGRGRDVTEFGDYFRTQKWNQGPGNDQPHLESDIIKNKVASSISHLYKRPRTWLEGFYGSGWGTTSAQVADATFRNFVMGHNLLTLHGLYYSTHGGWWEWAPPCNHFRMPYWEHMKEFLKCSERLSYLMSQGTHCCDVAILYPVAAMEAGEGGQEAVEAAFSVGETLYNKGIDFDFMDFESLDRAEIVNGRLLISGEAYRVLILPAMKVLRYSTLQKALQFYRNGGIVIGLDVLPEASDRIGRDDAELEAAVNEIFGIASVEGVSINNTTYNRGKNGGLGIFAHSRSDICGIINQAFTRDFMCMSPGDESVRPYVQHRKIGKRDVYMVYGVPGGTECFFRSKGRVELWDPWTGKCRNIHTCSRSEDGTALQMPGDYNEVQMVVFSPGEQDISEKDSAFGTLKKVSEIKLEGMWEFELKPTMDNRWGDFRLPAFDGKIGAEARKFKYIQETFPCAAGTKDERGSAFEKLFFDDYSWMQATYSFGPYFWKLGPLPDNTNTELLEKQLSGLTYIDPSIPVEIEGRKYYWKTYDFSMRYGVENDPGHQGYHGLKGEVSDDFIALGNLEFTPTGSKYLREEEGSLYYLWSSVIAESEGEFTVLAGDLKPAGVWVSGTQKVMDFTKDNTTNPAGFQLSAGNNPILLRYDQPGRTHFILHSVDAIRGWKQTCPLAMNWYNRPGIARYDIYPRCEKPVGWYRFTSPPGLKAMRIRAIGRLYAWVDGIAADIEAVHPLEDGSNEYIASVRNISGDCAEIILRIEQEKGFYGGAALPEPIAFECGPGKIKLGDWSEIDGLQCYSGGARYGKTFTVGQNQVGGRIRLSLGNVVSSAEIFINGQSAGIRVAPPWKADITDLVKPGENKVDIVVYNTLANHYTTIPTRYRGSTVSGLMGPVSIEIFEDAGIDC